MLYGTKVSHTKATVVHTLRAMCTICIADSYRGAAYVLSEFVRHKFYYVCN